MVNLLDDLKQELGLTYLFIAHDLSVINYISNRVAVMYLGHIVEEGETDSLFENPLHPYTQALMAAIPRVNKESRQDRIILPGGVPSPINPPSGCVFHPRCPIAVAGCKKNMPEFREIRPGHWAACSEI